ncbi:hypothetical protein V5F49_14410 [Xanthobacter sp. V3C-3]|uniref:hypothetical protein n=1 Tax=Xanthobacter lutulentifluminis TaxID=3119935 RepID=UPI0037295656
MNRIVRQNYPVEKLPEDLRDVGEKGDGLRVIVEAVPAPVSEARLRELLALARSVEPIGDDPVERIRQLRDEWED